MRNVCLPIIYFQRCGLNFVQWKLFGQFGGKYSHEFYGMADSGEDAIVFCDKMRVCRNLEKAEIGEPERKI